jgi:hypothetical protein
MPAADDELLFGDKHPGILAELPPLGAISRTMEKSRTSRFHKATGRYGEGHIR